MKWSRRIGRIAGIDVFVHATFPLLLAWIAWREAQQGASMAAIAAAVLLVIAVFGIVVLHELGHALAARRYGIGTRDITLLPIGGIARLERMPHEPRQELTIALAGPAVNVGLAAALYLALRLTGGASSAVELLTADHAIDARSVVTQLCLINVWLAVFNLVPAFPLDGGRALRALLAWRLHDYARATAAAARIGRALAVVLALVGLFVTDNPFLVVVAVFVWVAGTAEERAVTTSAALAGVPLTGLMITELHTLSPLDPLGRAAQYTIAGFQQDYPVLDGERLVGMLGRADLVRGLTEHGRTAPVSLAMQRTFVTVQTTDAPEQALARLAEAGGLALPVLRGGELVGVLTSENVMEYLMLRAATEAAARRVAPRTDA